MPVAILFAAVSGFVAVALGAWTAHGLDGRLPAQAMGWLRTGLDYQSWHAAALLAVAALARGTRPPPALRLAALGFAAGTVLFCGSLYLMASTGERWPARVTPFGGLAFLAGWAALGWYGVAVWARRPSHAETSIAADRRRNDV